MFWRLSGSARRRNRKENHAQVLRPVQSGQVQVILDAQDAEQAAITAFQWWCERQAEAMFDVFDDDDDRQLGNELLVSEAGFGAGDAESFPMLDILMAWQVEPVEVA